MALVIMAGLAGCYGCSGYNSLVGSQESVSKAWADVENQYQRRADLVPQLVQVVESAASIDQALIRAVRESNEAVKNASVVDPSDQAALKSFAQMQQRLSSNLSKLTSAIQGGQGQETIEAHRDLLVQLEGTENRVAVARRKYNEAVAEYNRSVRRFPKNVVAGLFGFKPRPAFTAEVN